MEARSLKQKIGTSRALYSKQQNHVFLIKLYQILEDSANSSAISWSADGTRILIKDTDFLNANVLPKFERCSTLINFFCRLDECKFFETYENDLGAKHVFEHLFLSRDKKPNTELVSKRKSRVQEENTVVSHKRVHKSNEPPMQEDLIALIRFEELLTMQINQRVQSLRQRILELDSDILLSNQVKKLINTLRAQSYLDLSME